MIKKKSLNNNNNKNDPSIYHQYLNSIFPHYYHHNHPLHDQNFSQNQNMYYFENIKNLPFNNNNNFLMNYKDYQNYNYYNDQDYIIYDFNNQNYINYVDNNYYYNDQNCINNNLYNFGNNFDDINNYDKKNENNIFIDDDNNNKKKNKDFIFDDDKNKNEINIYMKNYDILSYKKTLKNYDLYKFVTFININGLAFNDITFCDYFDSFIKKKYVIKSLSISILKLLNENAILYIKKLFLNFKLTEIKIDYLDEGLIYEKIFIPDIVYRSIYNEKEINLFSR